MYLEPVTSWISHYGYAGLFAFLALGILGLPVPDETLLFYAGYLISKGELSAVPTYLVAFAGSVCGITLSYLLGISGGHYLVARFGRYLHLGPDRIDEVHRWYLRIGKWVLLVGYFLVGVRHLTAFVAGSSRLEWRTFMLFAYTGAFVWSAGFISAGWWLGKRWHVLAHQFHSHIPLVTLIIAVAAILYALIRKRLFALSGGDREAPGRSAKKL
jgi:membrane protein DedA with SNARE-associated domain